MANTDLHLERETLKRKNKKSMPTHKPNTHKYIYNVHIKNQQIVASIRARQPWDGSAPVPPQQTALAPFIKTLKLYPFPTLPTKNAS